MLRIFMTGDNHIGLKYANHPRKDKLVSARIGAFENMVQIANDARCDLFVITGDLFENTYSIPKKDIKSLLELLATFHGTVAVLPGNHDYFDRDTRLWQSFLELMQTKDNILLLSEYRPYPLEIDDKEIVLYPALCTSLHSAPNQNHLDWIKRAGIAADSVYRIGIAHGSVEGETIDNEGRYFQMTRGELEGIPVDAWLIGHTHVPFPRNLRENAFTAGNRIFNAGTHVQTDVNCNTEGCCFILEIESGCGVKPVSARKVRSGNLRFYRRRIDVTGGQMAQILSRALADLEDNAVVDLILTGSATAGEYDGRKEILDNALSRFLESTYSDSALNKLISEDLINEEFPETSFSFGLLHALLEEPKEAQMIYDLLKALKEAGK